MIALRCASDTAIVVLHEIYGINPHIRRVCHRYHGQGIDVFCPNLTGRGAPFSREQQQEAYRFFRERIGFDPGVQVLPLLRKLRPDYRTLIVIGFSVGATLAWRSAASGLCDGIVCHYGSRIRDYSDNPPGCPALVIMARHEDAFNPEALHDVLCRSPGVDSHLFNSRHGFCDADSDHFDPLHARLAAMEVERFITRLRHSEP
ncbi:dienelactone hydrolase family protein [Entomohabitans teleogrylli]|uniref:dienelactone hydrolase family protein n=1 Tax=Entomohabitans teleogrylli TaxID=1384589 RepID=UPI000A4F64B2|nr:dienelactone hydrolase family protein [Entomohabitans teleogrylli]